VEKADMLIQCILLKAKVLSGIKEIGFKEKKEMNLEIFIIKIWNNEIFY